VSGCGETEQARNFYLYVLNYATRSRGYVFVLSDQYCLFLLLFQFVMRQGPCVLMQHTVVNVRFYILYLKKALVNFSSNTAVNMRFLNFCSYYQTHGLVTTALAKTRKSSAMLDVKRNSLCTFIPRGMMLTPHPLLLPKSKNRVAVYLYSP
jgi:hypothetical protein